MSGHITKMSRGSAWGRRRAGRAALPAVRRSGARVRGSCAPGRSGRLAQRSAAGADRVGGDVGLQPAEQGIGMFTAAEIFVGVRFGGRLRWSSRRSRPRVASSGWLTLRWLVSSRRGMGPVRLRVSATGRRWDGAARGADRGGWPAHGGARPRWTAAWCARTATAAAAGLSVIPQPCKGFGVPDVRWFGVHVGEQCPPQRGLPVEVGIDIAGDVTFPVDEQLRALPA